VDSATATAALMNNEVDWFEEPTPEQQALLRRRRELAVERLDPDPFWGLLRFNHLQPPFNDKRVRQALLPAVSQTDSMVAIVGTDPKEYVVDVGFFAPSSPFATDAGLAPLKGPRDLERAKRLLREAGYTNQPVRLIGPTDDLEPMAMAQVTADLFRRLGLNLDVAMTDWGTMLQRRTNRGPVAQGGWSVFCTAFSSVDVFNPIGHLPLRGNGGDGWAGWADIPRLEALRDAWFEATDDAARKPICEDMQRVAMDELELPASDEVSASQPQQGELPAQAEPSLTALHTLTPVAPMLRTETSRRAPKVRPVKARAPKAPPRRCSATRR